MAGVRWSGDAVCEAYFELLGNVERAARAVVLVALLGDEVVGTANVELDSTIEPEGSLTPELANFRMLAVDPRWRDRSVGHSLVAACLERARAAGKRAATLHTVDQMVAATHIYHALGFERDESADVALTPELIVRGYRLGL